MQNIVSAQAGGNILLPIRVFLRPGHWLHLPLMQENRTTVLIVDDDVRTRQLLERYMRGEGFTVMTAGDGRRLSETLHGYPIKLLILDLMLPGEDGLSICRRLRREGEEVPIIMLTAKGDEVDRIVGLEVGADDYLPKPFSPRELVARVNAV
ncbi:MAG TPA: response regulator, partial [Opitutaceae bacterium]